MEAKIETEIQVLFYVIAVLVVAMFWMKVVEALGWSLTRILLFIEEKIEKLEKWLSSPEDPKKKDRPLQAGDTCSRCEKGFLQLEYLPLHPAMAGDMKMDAPWPYNLVCSHCHAVTVGEY